MAYPTVALEDGSNFTKTIHTETYPDINPAKNSNLSNRAIFISGGSKGVGYATAIACARAGVTHLALGARSDFNIEKEIHAAASSEGHAIPTVLQVNLDVCDFATVEAASQQVEKVFGKLDILLNCAGTMEDFADIVASDREQYWLTWETNYRGIYWLTKAFIPLLLKTQDGLKTIVNTSSVGANMLSPGLSAYQTAKFALLRYTEFLMVEYGQQGLLAYAIHPGNMLTDMGRKLPKEVQTYLKDTPEKAGDTIVFLFQEKRDWLAGRYISTTWDMTEFLSREAEIVDGDKLKMRLVV